MTVPAHIAENMRWRSSRPCHCGSNLDSETLYDARGIPVVGVCCDACVVEKAKGFRRDIFEDGAYHADEPIEDDGSHAGDW